MAPEKPPPEIPTIDISASVDPDADAHTLIAALDLKPHPEGGYYREIFRDPDPPGGRGAATAIYYLLAAGERSHWHRIDAVEIWRHLAGAALAIGVSVDGKSRAIHTLGKAAGARAQVTVPKSAWQSAWPLGTFALVACIVAPAFRFEGFELAPAGWEPGEPEPEPRGP
ncbi:MAG TPA: cupin domain-containing protein [Alphaproteobacteria bacterium]|nr:cupin domain-containing protein [Alphaproteobacteria bacterium]